MVVFYPFVDFGRSVESCPCCDSGRFGDFSGYGNCGRFGDLSILTVWSFLVVSLFLAASTSLAVF